MNSRHYMGSSRHTYSIQIIAQFLFGVTKRGFHAANGLRCICILRSHQGIIRAAIAGVLSYACNALSPSGVEHSADIHALWHNACAHLRDEISNWRLRQPCGNHTRVSVPHTIQRSELVLNLFIRMLQYIGVSEVEQRAHLRAVQELHVPEVVAVAHNS